MDFGTYNLILNPVNTAVDIGGALYTFLLNLGLKDPASFGPTIAGSLSFVVAVISNFVWNCY